MRFQLMRSFSIGLASTPVSAPASDVANQHGTGRPRGMSSSTCPTATGFGDLEQGTVDIISESPDVATALHATVPAIEAVDLAEYRRSLTEVIAPLVVSRAPSDLLAFYVDIQDELIEPLRGVNGPVIAEGGFSPGPALWVGRHGSR